MKLSVSYFTINCTQEVMNIYFVFSVQHCDKTNKALIGVSWLWRYTGRDNSTEIPGPLSQRESRMSAYILIGKCKILNSKPESEEVINYYFIFHEI